jgi:hypothetical protein
MFLSQHFSFPLSVSFNQRPTLIVSYMMLLPEGQAGEAWDPSKSNALLEISNILSQRFRQQQPNKSMTAILDMLAR